MNVQIIEKDGQPEWAIIPYAEYERLREDAEMLQDVRAYDEAHAALAQGDEELIPAAVVDALLAGEAPLLVWRRFRGLSRAELARQGAISTPYLSQLERGRRAGSAAVLSRLADVLRVTVDDLLPNDSD